MSINITLNPVADLTNTTTAQSTINNNSTTVQNALTDALSLSGQTPNQMQSDFDMNGNNIVNLPTPAGNTSPVRLTDLNTIIGGGTIVVPVITAGTNISVTGTNPKTVSTITTPTFTSVNKVAITAPATSATLTIANGKTLTSNNTLTLTGTDGSSLNIGAGGTAAYATNPLSQFATTTSTQLASIISDETGSGSLVFGTTPTLTSPALTTPTLTTPIVTGTLTATSASASAVSFGANGATNPCLSVNNSTVSQVDGLQIGGGASGNGVALATISPSTNSPMSINTKGTGTLFLQNAATGPISLLTAVTAPTINKVTITAPTTSATLTIADGTTLTETTSTSIGKGQYLGTSTNDNATAGNIGEVISSSIPAGSAVSLTTGVQANVTSISLTAGDWDIWANVAFLPAASTVTTVWASAVSTTSATIPVGPNGGAFTQYTGFSITGGSYFTPVGMLRISLASTTTVFLVAQANFTVSTETVYGFLGARRAR